MFPQRICQREGTGGEQERVPQAEAAAADRARAQRIPGVDLQSGSVHADGHVSFRYAQLRLLHLHLLLVHFYRGGDSG